MKENIFLKDKNRRFKKMYDYNFFKWYCIHNIFFKSLIFSGRKLWAFKFLQMIKIELKNQEGCDSFWLILISFLKLIPEVILFPKKLGRKIQGVPLPITERKQYTFIIKWTIKLIRDRLRKVSLKKIVELILSSIYEKGEAFEQKLNVYQTSTTNRHLLRFFKR